MRRKLLGFLAVLLVLTIPLASAQAIDSKKLREDIIAGLAEFAGPSATALVNYEEVRVWPQGQGYRVEITGVTGQGGDLGNWMDLGDVAFSVQETKAGYYRVYDVALPASVRFYDAEGNQLALLAYDLKRFEGIWIGALSNFLELDLLVTDVRYGLTDGSLILSLDHLGGVSRVQQNGDGRTDQQASGRATGLHAEVPGEGAFDVAEIEGETSVTGMDLDAYIQLTREYEALAAQEGGPSEADLAAFIQRMSAMNVLPRGFGERISVSNVRVSDAAGQTEFALDRGEMDFAGSGLHETSAELRFGLKQDNLAMGESLRAQAGAMSALMPHDFGLVASLDRLPADKLWQSLLRTLTFALMQGGTEGQGSGAMDQMLLFMLMGEALPALTEAGTQVKLPHFVIESEAAKMTAEGAFDVDPASPQGVTGALQVAITGLDEVIALLESEINRGNQEALGALGMATWLKGLARRETDGESRAVDRYDLQLTADGQMLLNGQPFAAPMMPQ